MIELQGSQLRIGFDDVHPAAKLAIDFQRTLRIPDDGRDYPLPAGLGAFPLRHVDDFPSTVPAPWIEHGGVMLPMYQAEALWVCFHGHYPFAVKVAAGKINAVTGERWRDGLNRGPQDYLVTPGQPWLDGFCVEKGTIRQFVAMPLGAGYSAEEQITEQADVGGIQIVAYPLKREVFEQFARPIARSRTGYMSAVGGITTAWGTTDMGLAPGGRMKQQIYRDHFQLSDWDQRHRARCFVHIANALQWRAITGEAPPTKPVTPDAYRQAGIPWFDYYAADLEALEGSGVLRQLKSVARMGRERHETPIPENDPILIERVVQLRSGLRRSEVREGAF
jgi:hypothetical protein